MDNNYRQAQGEDYGILRKKEGKDEELFVFGYSCKIYEDYDKSLYVDQGKHLIPWLGDESLRIDRYDCRGALNDLSPYLPKLEGFNRLVGLGNEEKRIESLCDQERYRALTVNEDEELLNQEEELKRLQTVLNNEKSYGEVAFNYETNSKSTPETPSKESVEEEDDQFEQFIPPYQLDVPVGMKIPKSKKHHEIIEKTAFFISEQGAQMEILLKMKQADNPQFNFLSYDNELHPYYRHMMNAIKNGRYKQLTQAADEKTSDSSKSESISEDTYLHPSLIPSTSVTSLPELAPKIPTINYKPSNDCTYSVLVNRIKKTQSASRDLTFSNTYDKTFTSSLGNTNDTKLDLVSSSDSNDDIRNTLALSMDGLSKSARRRRARKEKEKEKNKVAVSSYKIYYAEEQAENNDKKDESPEKYETNNLERENNIDSLESSFLKPIPAPAPVLQIPSPDVQLIIDKMASYVVKNGRDFEAVVRAKGDPRFSFLDKTHIYNPFYNQKVELYLQLENVTPKLSLTESTRKIRKSDTNHSSEKTNLRVMKSSRSSKPIPICFSIKKPKEEELAIKSALPYEESECEEDEPNEGNVDREEPNESNEDSNSNNTPDEVEVTDVTSSSAKTCDSTNVAKSTEMTLEKWAQERLLAKLVTAAKEKLAAKDKDKQLQAERRKKAAEFINFLQKENPINRAQTSETDTKNESNGKKESGSDVITILSDSSFDSDSIVSIPLSCSDEDETSLKSDGKKQNNSPKKKSERSRSRTKENDRKSGSDNCDKHHRKSKHRHTHSSSRTRSRSRSHSRHSSCSKYKKQDKEKSDSKKKKHHYHQNSSHKDSYKNLHKSKRARYSNDKSAKISDSDSNDSSDSEMSTTRTS